MRMTKSKIGQYNNCPYAFYVKYVTKWKPEVMSPELKKGIEIHDEIDKAVKLSTISDEFIKHIRTSELYKTWKNHFDNVSKFQEWTPLPIGHELNLEDPNINFGGIIDRVQKMPNGDVILLDYKTGKEHDLKYYLFELSAYAHLYNIEYEAEPITHIGIFFTDTGIINTCKLNEDLINSALEEIKNKYEEINSKIDLGIEEFPKKKGILCRYCDLAKHSLCEGLNKTLVVKNEQIGDEMEKYKPPNKKISSD